MVKNRRIRIAAIADLHYGSAAKQPIPDLAKLAEEADVLVLCGDLTDRGLPEEAQGLMKELSNVKIPMIAVLGNHDFESGQERDVQRILSDGGVTVLDGEVCEVAQIGFAGVKGFAGGFGRGTLQSWGESTVKAFVQESVDETLKLEKALARLRSKQMVALLHYAPIRDTVEGEPAEIFPFLGCSRLEEPLNRFKVAAVFHGHAHRGTAQGKTQTGIPVYNVALPILRREFPNEPPVRRIELTVEPPFNP